MNRNLIYKVRALNPSCRHAQHGRTHTGARGWVVVLLGSKGAIGARGATRQGGRAIGAGRTPGAGRQALGGRARKPRGRGSSAGNKPVCASHASLGARGARRQGGGRRGGRALGAHQERGVPGAHQERGARRRAGGPESRAGGAAARATNLHAQHTPVPPSMIVFF